MRKIKGFTLIELMITVAIVAILASVAVPSYLEHVRTARRDDAKKNLMEAAQTMESFYALNMTYVGSNTGTTRPLQSLVINRRLMELSVITR